jgi:hypothetical protein
MLHSPSGLCTPPGRGVAWLLSHALFVHLKLIDALKGWLQLHVRAVQAQKILSLSSATVVADPVGVD